MHSAETSRDDAVTSGTHKKQSLVWTRWSLFLSQHGLAGDIYLDQSPPLSRVLLLGAFAEQVRQGYYNKGGKQGTKSLMADTAKGYVERVAAAFIDAERPDPRLDINGRPSHLLLQQWRG